MRIKYVFLFLTLCACNDPAKDKEIAQLRSQLSAVQEKLSKTETEQKECLKNLAEVSSRTLRQHATEAYLEAARILTQHASVVGESPEEAQQTGEALYAMGVQPEQVEERLGQFAKAAQQAGVTPAAFELSFRLITKALKKIGPQSDKSQIYIITTLVIALKKGLSPRQAADAVGGMFSSLQDNMSEIERITGMSIHKDTLP
jgi:DNA repair ATPase RecN